MRTMEVALSEMKIDPELVKLRKVNRVFVSRYRQSYRAGADMPKMIVEEKECNSKKYPIISGNTRYTALREEYPLGYTIPVIVKTYNNKKEKLVEFTHENIAHGNALDLWSRKKLSDALLKEGATAEEISKLFNISVKRLEDWHGHKVSVIGVKGQGEVKGKGTEEFVKQNFFPKNNELTQEEYKIHIEKDRGISVLQQATQLTHWLIGGHIKSTDQNIEALTELKRALDNYLKGLKKTIQ